MRGDRRGRGVPRRDGCRLRSGSPLRAARRVRRRPNVAAGDAVASVSQVTTARPRSAMMPGMFRRRARRDASSPKSARTGSPQGPESYDVLLAETIACHFDASRVEATTVHLGMGGVVVRCSVNGVHALGAHRAASLFFEISGGALGPTPIFASVSGYD